MDEDEMIDLIKDVRETAIEQTLAGLRKNPSIVSALRGGAKNDDQLNEAIRRFDAENS